MTIPAHVRIYSVFFLFALALGGLLSRMADLQHQLGVTESELGLTLIGMAIGSLISLTIASPIINRVGARWTGWQLRQRGLWITLPASWNRAIDRAAGSWIDWKLAAVFSATGAGAALAGGAGSAPGVRGRRGSRRRRASDDRRGPPRVRAASRRGAHLHGGTRTGPRSA